MWELLQPPSRRQLSARRIFAYALAAFTAALLWTLIAATGVHAADATWKNGDIEYSSNSYSGPVPATTVKDLGFRDGTPSYTYIDPSSSNPPRQIHVIYFASNTDPNVATSAKYRTYIYQGPGNYTNPSNPIDISVGSQSSPSAGAASAGTSSCAVDNGIGWIICPITNFLASGMDWVFNILSGFLAVRPVETGQNNALFRGWSYMLSFANIAFVIAFLIIIYSQLTNFGIDNYGIKKLLPRLIIAAVLVNVSYYISSIAVDISNILGYSIQDIFIQMRNTLVGPEGNSWNTTSWQSMASFILSGGTLATAGVIGLTAALSTYGVGGAIILLLPSLLAGLMAVLVAIVIMAARQAIVTILIILAPLAFVAYLLPNTEKWFEKWRSTFMTMLILFPAFSVVFGGSQLAASAIIQNADSINLIILGMLVQVAPLFITPMLIKLSGSLLGKIAGIVNDPSKGIIDRTKNWSKERADDIKAKRLGTDAGKYAFLKRNAQRVDHNRLKRERQRKIHEGMSANRYAGSFDGAQQYEAEHDVETAKKTIEERLSRDLSLKIQVTPGMLKREMTMHVTSDEAAMQKSKLDKIHEELRAGEGRNYGAALNNISDRSSIATRDLALTSIATEQAKRRQQANLSKSLMENTEIVNGTGKLVRQYAAGIDTANGADSALAFAVNQQYEAEAKLVGERSRLIKQFKLNGDERQILAMGKGPVDATATINGISANYQFSPSDSFARDAAVDMQMTIGSLNQIMEIVSSSGKGASLEEYMKTISDGIPSHGLPAKAAWMSGVFIDRVLRGTITDKQTQREAIVNYYIKPGKFKPEQLSTNDADAIIEMTRAIKIANRSDPDIATKLTALNHTIDGILDETSEVYANTSEASRNAFVQLQHMIDNPSDPSPPESY